jgi:cobalamin biosynthesis Co2+ chelatase CbiK
MKYKITITKTIDPINDIVDTVVNEYEVKARSEINAILKTLDKNNIKIKYPQVVITQQNNREFTAYLDDLDLYGIITQ